VARSRRIRPGPSTISAAQVRPGSGHLCGRNRLLVPPRPTTMDRVLHGRTLLLAGTICVVAACTAGGSERPGVGHGTVVGVQLRPVPEGPYSPWLASAGAVPDRNTKPLSLIRRYLPSPLPARSDQGGCDEGGDLVVRFSDGFEVAYGPCVRPPAIERLRLHVLRALDQSK
jgi:hypothetical protein